MFRAGQVARDSPADGGGNKTLEEGVHGWYAGDDEADAHLGVAPRYNRVRDTRHSPGDGVAPVRGQAETVAHERQRA